MTAALPLWVEVIVAVLLVVSGVITLIAAAGLSLMKTFFQRLHPTTLGYTLGVWCVVLASIIFFSLLESRLALKTWLVAVLLTITVPVTTTLLARAALFRMRAAGSRDAPGPLSH